MVQSIELVLDPDTEATIRGLWVELADAGISSPAPASRPHVTLTVTERIDPRVDPLLGPSGVRLPLACRLGAPLLFGRSQLVLARLVVPTAELLAVHAEVDRVCAPHVSPGAMPNTTPGRWTAHVTLARRVTPAQLGRALSIAGRPAEIVGRFTGLRRWDGAQRVEYLL